MFLTLHVADGADNKDALDEIARMIETNRQTYAEFDEKYGERFGDVAADNLLTAQVEEFHSLAIPKMIVWDAYDRGWLTTVRYFGLYKRE